MFEITPKKWGKRAVKSLRIALVETPDVFAARIGVSVEELYAWESGEEIPPCIQRSLDFLSAYIELRRMRPLTRRVDGISPGFE